MVRNRLIYGILVVALIAVLTLLGRSLIGERDMMALPAPSYNGMEDWAYRAQNGPEPVWKTGWTTDVVLILNDAGIEASSEKQLASRTERAKKQASALATDLDTIGYTFAPLYRRANADDDQSKALMAYLSANQGRAFFIATDVPLSPQMLAPIEALGATDRFGGYILIGDVNFTPSPCPTWSDNCTTTLPVIREEKLLRINSEANLNSDEGLFGFQNWLADNLSPMAEPFGDFEEVEVIDIRRPGDTDEAREREAD